MYTYASGPDKVGNTLITSYKKKEQADKYRPGATYFTGFKYLNISEDGQAVVSNEGELLLRTMLSRKDVGEPMEGNFVVYAKINGKWQKTDFRYTSYASANTAVKGALIQIYDACAVVEE